MFASYPQNFMRSSLPISKVTIFCFPSCYWSRRFRIATDSLILSIFLDMNVVLTDHSNPQRWLQGNIPLNFAEYTCSYSLSQMVVISLMSSSSRDSGYPWLIISAILSSCLSPAFTRSSTTAFHFSRVCSRSSVGYFTLFRASPRSERETTGSIANLFRRAVRKIYFIQGLILTFYYQISLIIGQGKQANSQPINNQPMIYDGHLPNNTRQYSKRIGYQVSQQSIICRQLMTRHHPLTPRLRVTIRLLHFDFRLWLIRLLVFQILQILLTLLQLLDLLVSVILHHPLILPQTYLRTHLQLRYFRIKGESLAIYQPRRDRDMNCYHKDQHYNKL